MAWNDAIVRVCVQNKDKWNIGTGFFVDRGLLLTARHLFEDVDGADPLICVANYHGIEEGPDNDQEPGQDGFGPCGEGFAQAKVVWSSEPALDVALLSCDPGDEVVLRLAAREHGAMTPLVSGGYPRGAKVENRREYFQVSGQAHTRRSDFQIFQYDLTTSAHAATDWGGMSGAPVFDEVTRSVFGVVVHARKAMEQSGFLEVIPAAHILQAEGFAQHFGDWRSHELPETFRTEFLAKVEERLDQALSDLTETEMDDLTKLVKRADQSFAREVSAATLFRNADAVVGEIGRTQGARHREDAEAALQFGLIGQLLCYDAMSDDHLRLISYVRSKREDTTADPFSSLAHTLTLLEMLAAATDELDPSLPAQRDPAKPPSSNWILPFALSESGAAFSDGQAASIAHLARKTGVDLVSADVADERIDSFYRGEGLLYPAERNSSELNFTNVAEELSIRLSSAKARGERSYVLPAIRPESAESAALLKASLQRLKGLVPELLIMGLVLDDRGALTEERELQSLLNTIPVKNTKRRRLRDDPH